MERNLEALERKRTALSGGGNSSRDRARILASLDANNCRDAEVAEREPRRDDRSLFDRLFGNDVPEGLPMEEPERQPFEQQPSEQIGAPARRGASAPSNVTRILNPNGEVSVLGPAGEFATMCVRTCDGYYFPMSPNSSSADFDRDLKNCESSCPGTEMQLYYQGAVGDESETMISAGTGEPYASLPTAYLYRDAAMSRAARLRLQSGEEFFDRRRRDAAAGRTRRAGNPAAGRAPGSGRRSGNLRPIARAGSTSKPSSASSSRRRPRRRLRHPESTGSGSSGQCSFPTQKGQ